MSSITTIIGAATGLTYRVADGRVWGVLDADLALGLTPERVYPPTVYPDGERKRVNGASHRGLKGSDVAYVAPSPSCNPRCRFLAPGSNGCGLHTFGGGLPVAGRAGRVPPRMTLEQIEEWGYR